VERWFDIRATDGIKSLSIRHGRGVKTRLAGYEKEVAQQVEHHSRNLRNVIFYFKEQHDITVCKKTL
jgi:hypothetical protein